MTSLIDNNIDELMKRVREYPTVSDFVYMNAFPPRGLPSPVDRYTVAVMNNGYEVSRMFIGECVDTGMKGSVYDVALTLRVFAPSDTAGSALLRATSLLMDAVSACDVDGYVSGMSVCGIAYESDVRTVYRDIRLTLSMILCEEAEV